MLLGDVTNTQLEINRMILVTGCCFTSHKHTWESQIARVDFLHVLLTQAFDIMFKPKAIAATVYFST